MTFLHFLLSFVLNTQDSEHIFKHLGFREKYSAAPRIAFFSVLVFGILLKILNN